jgi:hypothetical protein
MTDVDDRLGLTLLSSPVSLPRSFIIGLKPLGHGGGLIAAVKPRIGGRA